MNSETPLYKPEKESKTFIKLTFDLLIDNSDISYANASILVDQINEILSQMSNIGFAGISKEETLTTSEFYNELTILETDSVTYFPFEPTEKEEESDIIDAEPTDTVFPIA